MQQFVRKALSLTGAAALALASIPQVNAKPWELSQWSANDQGEITLSSENAIKLNHGNQAQHQGDGDDDTSEAIKDENESKDTEAASSPKRSPLNAIELKYGKFGWGNYAPTATNNYSSCTAITLCNDKGLFGNVLTAKYIRRIYSIGLHALDIDGSVDAASQSIELTTLGNKYEPTGGDKKNFAMMTLVPTYRLSLPATKGRASIGFGAGINIALGSIPYEQPYDIPLNTQFNIELAVSPLKDKTLQLTASLEHRCSFFGALNTADGTLTGSHWYNFGIRKWF